MQSSGQTNVSYDHIKKRVSEDAESFREALNLEEDVALTDGSNIDPAPFRDELNVYDKGEVQTRLNPRAVAGALRFENGNFIPDFRDFNPSAGIAVSFMCRYFYSSFLPSKRVIAKDDGFNQRSWRLVFSSSALGRVDLAFSENGSSAESVSSDTGVIPDGRWFRMTFVFDAGFVTALIDESVVISEQLPTVKKLFENTSEPIRFNANTDGSDAAHPSPIEIADLSVFGYPIPLETTGPIIGIRDRIRNGSMVVPGLDDVMLQSYFRDSFDTPDLSEITAALGSSISIVPSFEGESDVLLWEANQGQTVLQSVIFPFPFSQNQRRIFGYKLQLFVDGESTINGVRPAIGDALVFSSRSVTAGQWVDLDLGPGILDTASFSGSFRVYFRKPGAASGGISWQGTPDDKVYFRLVAVDYFGAPIDLRPDTIQPAPAQWINAAPSHTGPHPLMSETGVKETAYLTAPPPITVRNVNASSNVFLLRSGAILGPDWVIDRVYVKNDGADGVEQSIQYSGGSSHVSITDGDFEVAGGTEKLVTAVNGRPAAALNRIRVTGDANATDMTYIIYLRRKPA